MTVIKWSAGWLWFASRQGSETFFSKAPRSVLESSQPPAECGGAFPWGKSNGACSWSLTYTYHQVLKSLELYDLSLHTKSTGANLPSPLTLRRCNKAWLIRTDYPIILGDTGTRISGLYGTWKFSNVFTNYRLLIVPSASSNHSTRTPLSEALTL